MDGRLSSRASPGLAKGQETIGLLVNDIHGRVIKLAQEGSQKHQ